MKAEGKTGCVTCDNDAMKDDLLKEILRHYSSSRDFNGLFFTGGDRLRMSAAIELVRGEMVQVVSEEDYPNPHIRPWPSRRSIEQQVASIESLDEDSYGVCLYPTPVALKKHRPTKRYPGQPFKLEMAKGRGTLELAYFSSDVLEQYRNDPRFSFDFNDFGAHVSISDDAYLDTGEPDHDKTSMRHIGFAYDLSGYKSGDLESPILRRVCAFYGDLAGLTSIHQQRWKTYQVPSGDVEPHPVWWAQQMGNWPDGLGPFQQVFFGLEALNELYQNAFGLPLFKTTERPGDFGWILRPSQHEWDSFVHQLDKLLSDNIQHAALNSAGVPRKGEDGNSLGTLSRVAALLASQGVSAEVVSQILKPLRDVREARQKPAHSLRKNITDKTFINKQIALLEQVTRSLRSLQAFLQSHPANAQWESKRTSFKYNYRM